MQSMRRRCVPAPLALFSHPTKSVRGRAARRAARRYADKAGQEAAAGGVRGPQINLNILHRNARNDRVAASPGRPHWVAWVGQGCSRRPCFPHWQRSMQAAARIDRMSDMRASPAKQTFLAVWILSSRSLTTGAAYVYFFVAAAVSACALSIAKPIKIQSPPLSAPHALLR